ncbi:MAG: type I phosphomannose isomerase catalytic subunit [Spirochaetia bacterium]
MKNNKTAPILLEQNRVWRTYTGGMLLDSFQGISDPRDGHFPEEWAASITSARNSGREHIKDEGLSRISAGPGQGRTLKELIQDDPEAYLGKTHARRYGSETGILAKLLDSSERLTVQVHPDYAAAEKFFGSRYGKIESWYVLGGRTINGEEPYILMGFKEGITRQKWEALFRDQDISGMLDCLHKFPVVPGEAFLITGGLPHAIGPGCFFIELQEPTDFSIRPERTTPGGTCITDEMCHQGAGFDGMFEIFHYDGAGRDEIYRKFRREPVTVFREPHASERLIISSDDAPFGMAELMVTGEYMLPGSDIFSVWIIIEGEGYFPDSGIVVKKGSTLFMPPVYGDILVKRTGGTVLKIIRCMPPVSGVV